MLTSRRLRIAVAALVLGPSLAFPATAQDDRMWRQNERSYRIDEYLKKREGSSGAPSSASDDLIGLLLLRALQQHAGMVQARSKLQAEYDKADVVFPDTFKRLVAGTWHGTYVCQQGKTGLTLKLTERSDGGLDGRFVFHPVRSNPDVPRGEFEVRVLHGHTHMFIEPVKWVKRPPTYHMVGLAGRLDRSELSFIGAVQTNGCREFALKKAD